MRITLLDFKETIKKLGAENNASDTGVALDISMQIAKDFIDGETTLYSANDVSPSELAEFIKYVRETDRDLIHEDRQAYNEYFINKWRKA